MANPLQLVGVAILASAVSAQAGSPEAVIRSFVHAMYSNDLAAYEALTVPIPGRERLEKGGAVNVEAKEELEQYPEAVQLRMMRPYQYPMLVSLVRTPEGWRIDLRWWLAMLDMAAGPPPSPDSADYAARALIASLIELDRQAAPEFVIPDANLDVLFTGAPPEPEPFDQLGALLLEMPLVEIGPAESAKCRPDASSKACDATT